MADNPDQGCIPEFCQGGEILGEQTKELGRGRKFMLGATPYTFQVGGRE